MIYPAVHGGIDEAELRALGRDRDEVVDFSANQSPVNVSSQVREAIFAAVVETYPDRDACGFARAVAAYHDLNPAQVVVGNGSTEIIRLIAQIVLREGDVALSVGPSFGEYRVATALARAVFVEHSLALEDGAFIYRPEPFIDALNRLRPELCWLCSPNNPTGVALPAEAITELVCRFPGTAFVLDEAYCDLLLHPQWTPATLTHRNLIVLRSMTKAWGLAGLRLGYALAHHLTAAVLRAAKPPWNVNVCAQAAGIAVLKDPTSHNEAVRLLRAGRDHLVASLRADGWAVPPTEAAFFLVDVGDAQYMRKRLLVERGCLVRDCSSFGLPQFVRVSPRLPEHNELLLAAFAEAKRIGRRS